MSGILIELPASHAPQPHTETSRITPRRGSGYLLASGARLPRSIARHGGEVALIIVMIPVALVLGIIGVSIATAFGVPFSSATGSQGEPRLPDIAL